MACEGCGNGERLVFWEKLGTCSDCFSGAVLLTGVFWAGHYVGVASGLSLLLAIVFTALTLAHATAFIVKRYVRPGQGS